MHCVGLGEQMAFLADPVSPSPNSVLRGVDEL